MAFKCLMCFFSADNNNILSKHIVRNHRFDPNFRVSCNVCGATYDKWASYVGHRKRKHPALIHNPVDDNVQEEERLPGDEDQHGVIDFEGDDALLGDQGYNHLKLNAAKFLLHARETSVLSQRALTNVVDGVNDLVTNRDNAIKRNLLENLQPTDEQRQVVNNVFDEIQGNIFQGLGTKHLLDKYLVGQSSLILPVSTLLGEEFTWIRTPTLHLARKKVECQIIPFQESLEQLLNNEDILYCVDHPRGAEGNLIKDYRDGYFFKTHPVFSNNPTALIIELYYDDVEIVNPLGSKVKVHKLGFFYWMIGNIYPELRSSLKVINLLAIVKTTSLRKYGFTNVLENVLQCMRGLESEEGVVFQILGRPRTFRGSVLFFVGDTLASNYVGGYKEGVGFASRPCRTCMVKREELRDAFHQHHFVKRDKATHIIQCARVEEPNLTLQARNFWSTFYGITRSSPLSELTYFDVTKCFPHDFMHVFPEGMLHLEIKLLLTHCITEGYFNIQELNFKIANFDYQHMSKNKPSPIEPIHLEHNLRQNASQMMTLGYVLPFLIGEFVIDDDEHFKNYIRLIQIMNVCLAFEIESEDISMLETMIEIHHLHFVTLYPNASVTPKMHYMVHLPEQIRQFGPLRHHWCMRFEAAHYHFGVLAKTIKNFKNIAYSLAYRHQALRCSQLMTAPGEPSRKFLYPGDMIHSGTTLKIRDHQHANIIGPFLNEPYETEVVVSPCIIVHGTNYRKGAIILISCTENEMPKFGQIVQLLVSRQRQFIIFKQLNTLYFESKLNAYRVVPTQEQCITLCPNELHPHNLSIFKYNSSPYVILLHHSRTEFEG